MVPRESRLGVLHKRIAVFWLYPSIMIVLMQFSYSYTPRAAVEASVTVNQKNPYATLYRVTNTSPWYLINVRFNCKFTTNGAIVNMGGHYCPVDRERTVRKLLI